MENEEESNDWTPEIIRTLIRSVCVLWNGDFQVSAFCITIFYVLLQELICMSTYNVPLTS